MSSPTAAEPARRWSLAARLTAWYIGSAFALILTTTCFLYWAVVTTLDREDDQYLVDKARVLLSLVKDDPDNEVDLRDEVQRESSPRPAGQILVRVLDNQGRTIAETDGMHDSLPPARFHAAVELASGAAAASELQTSSGRSFRTAAMRSPQGWTVQVAMDRTAEEALLSSYRSRVAAILAGALLVCAVTGYALARHGLRPLRDVTQATRRVRSSTLHERLNVAELPAELAELAETFNEMLNRLEESFRRLEQFSADIAHELRTPVNNLRGEAEVALGRPRTADEYREVLESGLEEYGRLSTMIDSLLFLARAESPQAHVPRQPLDLRRELDVVRDCFMASADEAGITLNVQSPDGVIAELDRTLFQRALSNLVSNALAHTQRGGTITLSALRSENSVRVEVADSGRGIEPEHLPNVFDRFYRVDRARTSTSGSAGLGLAIVKSIATIHGGACTIESEVGKGTRVRLEIPTTGPTI
jgi:two-component system, OmpR family, heavy metal sensor histidine kinase CusS